MKVGVFLPDYNDKHVAILHAFASGIAQDPATDVELHPLGEYRPCDLAVIFGMYKKAYEPTWPKKDIIARHERERLIVIESAFVRRGKYWAVGFGGQHGNADFCNAEAPPDRWQMLDYKVRPWIKRPTGPVLVCGQLPRDTNVQDLDHVGWCRWAVRWLQDHKFKVLFRPHPREKEPEIYGIDPDLWDKRKMRVALKDARCLVTWNSTSATEAAIAGVPVIACSPDSFARAVAGHTIEAVAAPPMPDRRAWLAGLGYAQWSREEMDSGAAWAHLARRWQLAGARHSTATRAAHTDPALAAGKADSEAVA